MRRKAIVILGVILAMMCMFSGCNKENEQPVDTGTQPADTPPDTPDTPDIPETPAVSGTLGEYVLITPDRMSKFETETANSLFSKLESKAGVELEYEEGSYTEETPERFEILVGDTGRVDTAAALAKLDYNQYGVFVSDYKIVVTGWTEYTTRLAVMQFNDLLADCVVKNEDGTQSFQFTEKEMIKTYSDYLGELPAFEGSLLGAYDCSDNCYALWYEDVEASCFETYAATVKGAGYALVNENKIGDNSYATYTKDDRKIHFYYIASEDEFRIVYGPNDVNTDLMQAAAETPAGTVTPSVTLMPMRYISAEGGGACMVYTLEDGTFFVIDGGWKEEAEVLYKTLCALNEDANGADHPIVISAWFISHAHGDHTGCIYEFAKVYGSQVKVNALICNDAHVAQTADAKATTAGALSAGKLKSGVLRYLVDEEGNNPEIMKLHTGQKLTFGGMELDVMFTHEDMFDIKVTNFNDFNTVIRIKLGGATMFIGNDATKKELPALIQEIAPAELKAEFCMVMHHGADSGYKGIYEIVDADYYFWPNSKPHYDRDILVNKYDYCLYVVENAKEIYLADTYCTTLELPYVEGSAIKWLPDTEKPSDKKSDFSTNTAPSYGDTVAWDEGRK